MNDAAHADLYRSLLERDPKMDDRYFVAVRSTGIFCRLSCPARKPKPENCLFLPSAAECLSRGYRPCKRCLPLGSVAEQSPVVEQLLGELDSDPLARWNEETVIEKGYDPSTVRRAFKRHFGMTFLALARLRRLQRGSTALAGGSTVIDAQLEAGFESGSGFRAAIAKLLGVPPRALTRAGPLTVDWVDSSLGPMVAVADERALRLLEFADRRALGTELRRLRSSVGELGIGKSPLIEQIRNELADYFSARSARFRTPIVTAGTDLQKSVWAELQRIPVGETRSYSQVADAVGRPSAVRAVARANGANQLAIIVPCHRVVGADGSMTGYGGGIWRKRKLIAIESELAGRLG